MSERVKITVMVPVEVEVSVHPAGNVRVHGCINPTFADIEDQLQVFQRFAAINSSIDILTVLPDWIICKK